MRASLAPTMRTCSRDCRQVTVQRQAHNHQATSALASLWVACFTCKQALPTCQSLDEPERFQKLGGLQVHVNTGYTKQLS